MLRCLQKDPGRRFHTVADLAEALARFGPADGPARARRVRRILESSGIARRPAGAPPVRSHRLARGLALAAVLGVGAAVLMQHASYVQSKVLAGRSWKGWKADQVAHATAATQEMRAGAASPPAPALAEPVAPAIPTSASPETPASGALSEAPSLAPLSDPAPIAAPAARQSAPHASVATHSDTTTDDTPAMIEALLAEARGDTVSPDSTAARVGRAHGAHRSGSRKHYVIEPVPSPNPAPPIVVPASVATPVSAAKSTDAPTPYDDNGPVPDLGRRE